jgi:DNA-binding HxlR family transcriptional regulator
MDKKICHSDCSPCPVAHALDIIGDRWTLLIVRDLMFCNIHEYKEMLGSSEGISTNILSDRLKRLSATRLIDSINHPESKTRKLYYLTPAGKNLIHAMVEIAKWAKDNLGTVSLPPEIEKQLDHDPEGMIKDALLNLEKWEAIFLTKE